MDWQAGYLFFGFIVYPIIVRESNDVVQVFVHFLYLNADHFPESSQVLDLSLKAILIQDVIL